MTQTLCWTVYYIWYNLFVENIRHFIVTYKLSCQNRSWNENLLISFDVKLFCSSLRSFLCSINEKKFPLCWAYALCITIFSVFQCNASWEILKAFMHCLCMLNFLLCVFSLFFLGLDSSQDEDLNCHFGIDSYPLWIGSGQGSNQPKQNHMTKTSKTSPSS